ncbi:DUF4435 domain-containing protein [Oceanisphaera sp. IT1-181]|uniref:DUF4435 domain-containing protein n=1 Tax=Oceanisphaera sp. IT1-181 TaxID=3081199 RepID=UPI0029CA0D91|nr:DUF4435 domain-containing protein [Oceanisphaera sp. IT1-181]
MASINTIIKNIKEQKIGASQKRVFVVEGSDDVHSFELLMSRVNSNWSQKWVIAPAGSKKNVVEIIKQETNWVGLVDRDDWQEDKITELSHQYQNLLFLPRYCIENYLINPDELWQALPDKQQAKIIDGLDGLRAALVTDLDKWVRHGILWSVVNPLWEGLRSLGFKDKLLDPKNIDDEGSIIETLREWHVYLDPERIWTLYQEKMAEVNNKSQSDKLSLFVHGKCFYEQVVDPALDQLLGQKGKNHRQFSIIKNLPAPEDLQPVWQKLELI